MTFGFYKYNAPLECFAVWEGGFTPEEVDKIVYMESLQNFGKAKVGSQNADPAKDVRDSEVAWIHPDEHSSWLFERLGLITSTINHQQFMYDIEGVDLLQYTKYNINQHYTWHWDVEFGWQNFQRKISATMMLSVVASKTLADSRMAASASRKWLMLVTSAKNPLMTPEASLSGM